MRIALGLEYCGTAYCGWQSQLSGVTVQDRLELALKQFLGEPTRVICAGRTDTGVHATAQVVHLDTTIVRDTQSWVRGTNAHLPDDIRVLWAHRMTDEYAEEFHARFSAQSRTYQYLLLNDAVSAGLQSNSVGWFHAPLNVAAMQRAANTLLGEHDFSAFRSSECQAKTPIKTLYEASIATHGQLIQFRFRANAFLHHMVRNLVGSLVYIGAGRQGEDWLKTLLESRNRALAAPTFAPDGLYLYAIEYDKKFTLPAFGQRHPFLASLKQPA
jgi:tRNA pseudouridine38-40 synthase